MSLPANYQWLNNVGVLPRTIQEAIKIFGVHEVSGRGSNPVIMSWRDELNKAGYKIEGYSDDDIPWCGLCAAFVAFKAGKVPVKDPLWARNWASFGVKADKASLGDCLVFVRNGGGHVAWYVGEDSECYHCLGGNQSDQVCFTRVPKSRCIAVRRPKYNVQPDTVKPHILKSTGAASKNEA